MCDHFAKKLVKPPLPSSWRKHFLKSYWIFRHHYYRPLVSNLLQHCYMVAITECKTRVLSRFITQNVNCVWAKTQLLLFWGFGEAYPLPEFLLASYTILLREGTGASNWRGDRFDAPKIVHFMQCQRTNKYYETIYWVMPYLMLRKPRYF